MNALETRCRNCGKPAQSPAVLCPACEQDILLQQAQLEQTVRRGLRCID